MSDEFKSDIKKNISSSWFRKRFRAEIRATFRLKSGGEIESATLAAFLEQLLLKLPPIPYFKELPATDASAIITNIRGRPPESFPGHANSEDAGSEELLFLSGLLINDEDEKNEDEIQAEIPLRFSVRSKFSEFVGAASIKHHVEAALRSPLADEFPTPTALMFTRLSPLQISRVRVGLEFFRGRHFGDFLGLTPDMYGHCFIEADTHQIQIDILDEQLPTRESPLLNDFQIADTIESAIALLGVYASLK